MDSIQEIKQNKPLNILLVISKMGKGGAQRIVLDLANGYVRNRVNVDLLVFYRTPQDRSQIKELDPQIGLLNVFNISLPSDHQSQFQKYLPLIVIPLLTFWWTITGKFKKYDIVHSNLLLASVFSWFAALFHKIFHLKGPKFVETFHADLIALAKWEQFLYFILWKQQDVLVTELRRKDYEILQIKFPQVRLCYIPFGIIPLEPANPEDISLFRKQFAIKKNIPVILSITRLNHREKKILTLVETIHSFRKLYSNEFIYLVVGDGPDRITMQTMAESLGLSDMLCFTGYLDNINIPCSIAKVFLITGVEDLVGIAGLQAASLGIPIVSYQVDPGWENRSPIFFNSPSLDVMAQEIKELLENETHYKEAHTNALEAVKSIFSVDQMIASYLSLYFDLQGT